MKRFCCVLSMTLFIAASAYAQEGNDLQLRSDFLSRSTYMESEYHAVRDDLEKPGGYRDQFDGITSDMTAWLDKWTDLDNYTRDPPSTTSLTELDQQLAIKLNAIDDSLHSIETKASDLEFSMQAAADRLTNVHKIDYRIDGYQLGKAGQDDLEKRLDDLSTSLRQSVQPLAGNLVAFRAAMGSLRQAFSYRASAFWVNKSLGTLDQEIQTVDELFTAQAALQPLQDQLLKSIGAYQTDFSRYNMTVAFDDLTAIKGYCSSLPGQIDALSIEARYKQAAKDRFAPYCTSYAKAFDRFNGHLPQAVLSGIKYRKPRIVRVCQSEQSQVMNCPLFASIEALSEAQILAMKDDSLRNLEKLYTAIENNHRHGPMFH